MNSSEAVVVRLDGRFVWLEILDRPAGCGGCQSAAGCGAGGRQQRVLNTVGAQVGDHVTVNVPPGAVMRAAALGYLLPLVLLLGGALLGGLLGSELLAVAGALAGVAAGWAALAVLGRLAGGGREPLLERGIKPAVIRLQRNQPL